MSYLGNPPVVQATRTLSEFVATSGQTTFTPPGGYQVGYVDVIVNGSMLQQSDFTATDGSTVVLASACSLLDDVRIIALGTFSVANATPADGSVTAAKIAAAQVLSLNGIKFPASQVASSDANTLDDYEEGTWTPTLISTGTAPTVSSYVTQQGIYTKVGNLVTATCSIRATISSIGSGVPVVRGLPFTAAGYLEGVALGLYTIITSAASAHKYVVNTDVYFESATYNTNAQAYITFTVSYRV